MAAAIAASAIVTGTEKDCRVHASLDPRPRWCQRCEDELRDGSRKCPHHQGWEPRPRWCSRCLEEWRAGVRLWNPVPLL